MTVTLRAQENSLPAGGPGAVVGKQPEHEGFSGLYLPCLAGAQHLAVLLGSSPVGPPLPPGAFAWKLVSRSSRGGGWFFEESCLKRDPIMRVGSVDRAPW